jgi:hypothetical protein
MSHSSLTRVWFIASSLVSFLTVSTSAFCGLQSCPRPAGAGEASTLEAALRTRGVSYDIAGNTGHYLVTAPRVFVNYGGLAVGAEIPITRLDNDGVIATGLSNPVVMARYARRFAYAWSGEVGLQWELPIGNQADGLAGDHHMLLPWVGVRHDVSPAWFVTGMFGISSALEFGGHSAGAGGASARTVYATPLFKAAHAGHDHETPVLVNPHADRELQTRAAIGWSRGRGIVEAFGLTQTDITSDKTGTYARAGGSYEWTIARFTALQFFGDLPVTTTRRNEGELGLLIKTGL